MDLAAARLGAPLNPARGGLGTSHLPSSPRGSVWCILHVALYLGCSSHASIPGAGLGAHGLRGLLLIFLHGCRGIRDDATPFPHVPDVATSEDWRRMWQWVTISRSGSAALPRSAAVLLEDDDRAWRPDGSDEHGELWTILQLS